MWSLYQPNEKDKKNKASDCVVRAFCYVSGDSWATVFKELCEIALKKQLMPNGKRVYEQYLRNHGFECQGLKIERGHSRPTVDDFTDVETTCYPERKYVLVCANHLVAAQDGWYYDTWESGDKSVYSFWWKMDQDLN